jgi:hypothetical protein
MSFELMAREPENVRMPSSSSASTPTTEAVVIRRAYPDDVAALERLASLDSRRPITGAALVAERDGRILAALSLDDGRAIADPFAPTADLVSLLHLRAEAASTSRRDGIRRRRAVPGRRPAIARG